VLRAELSCPEEVLLAKDLGLVQLWVGNALRGLIPARLT
jgi:4-amino-4-deoxychorismate lyase